MSPLIHMVAQRQLREYSMSRDPSLDGEKKIKIQLSVEPFGKLKTLL